MRRGGYSGRGGFGAGHHTTVSSSSSDGRGYHGNPCLTMHQPWASLLVHGIKRVEGRSWPSPITGRLWIHAASKVPDPDTIKAMEDFYREIYAVDGITDINFPQHYPVSRLLGCVQVVGCLRSQELVCWEDVPQSVRLEGLTDFCWLCENPQKLVVPFEMRGYQGVYNLERRIYDGAVRGLTPVQGPLPVKFPLPDPRDGFSLKPGSLTLDAHPKSALQKSPSVTAAIAGARAAATQFSKKDHNGTQFSNKDHNGTQFSNKDHNASLFSNKDHNATQLSNKDHNAAATSTSHVREQCSGNGNLPSIVQGSTAACSQNPDAEPLRRPRLEYGASNRLVTVALRELKQLSGSGRGGGQPVGRS